MASTSNSAAQQFCVRWNNYQSNLQNSFPKLLLNEHFVDVTLACEGQLVKCHKVVLSACSTYFEQMLSQNPCQHPIIFMKDMKCWEVRALVDFMYRGEVNVTQEELSSLLKAAEALQVRGLYGYEQQRAAAAAAACSKTGTEGASEEQQRKTPSLPANTTVQECATHSRPSSPQQEDSNDQMVKLEEEIMMIEEQSISDMDSQLDNDFPPLGNSQEFDGFVGDQRYPPPPLDSAGLAGPSGLTMSAVTTTSSSNNCSQQDGLLPGSRFSLPNMSSSQCPLTGQASSGDEDANSPMKRIRRSERELSEAAGCIVRGLTFQSVSDRYKIPISTIRFYMARKGILPRRKRGRTNRFDDMPKQEHHNGPAPHM